MVTFTTNDLRPVLHLWGKKAMMIFIAIGLYLASGLVFGIAFVTRLIHAVDEGSAGSSWTFRLMILPGCIVLWPLLLRKYFKVRRTGSHD